MKLLHILALSTLCLGTAAQEVTPVADGIVALRVPQRAGSEYVNMSYCSDNIQCSVALQNGSPTKTAIAITRGMLGKYADAEIVGVRVGLAGSATNVSGWIVEGSDPSKSVAENSPSYAYMDRGWHDLFFRSPYTFSASQGSGSAIIIGYTSTGTDQIGFDGEEDVYDNGNFMWCASRGWGSVANVSRQNGYGNACVQILLGGVELPTTDMTMSSIITKHAEQGKPVVLRGTVSNKVPTPVTSYTLQYCVNDGTPTTVEMHQNVNNDKPAEFELTLPPFQTAGPQQVTLTITSVNGEVDAEPGDNTLTATIESVEEGCYFPQVHVIEESTNLECGFCPRGIAIMESLEERHQGSFIGIAVHSDVTSQSDPFFVPSYYSHLSWLLVDEATMSISEPNGIMNRNPELQGDPLFWDSFYDRHEQDLSDVGLKLAEVSAVHDGKIDVQCTARFRYDLTDHPYRVAFVLTEDDVFGVQMNYYYDGSCGNMAGWENRPQRYAGPLDHIARGIWDYDGLAEVLPATVQKKVDYPVSYTIDLAQTDYADADCLSVVALVIDSTTGMIVQADRMAVGGKSEGVNSPLILNHNDSSRTYNLAGQQQHLPSAHGIYIHQGRKAIR